MVASRVLREGKVVEADPFVSTVVLLTTKTGTNDKLGAEFG
jgi:hypothetical protein